MTHDAVVTVIQARTGSSRFPGKVLYPVCGRPLLLHQLYRVSRAALAGRVVVATTTDTADDEIVSVCRREGFDVYRGHPTDLLDRHLKAAEHYGAHTVVKIPSDCPLIDPSVIDRVLGVYAESPGRYDFVSNLHPATWPDGNDVEVFSMDVLRAAHAEASEPYQREHTTPWIWSNSHRFNIGNVEWAAGLNYSLSHRWVLDWPEDARFIEAVYDALWHKKPDFGLEDILLLLESKPELSNINGKHRGYQWYNAIPEARTVHNSLSHQG